MTNLLTVVANIFSVTLIFLLKNVSSFCNAKATHIFQQNISRYLPYFKIEIFMSHYLATLLSFEHLGPDFIVLYPK